MSLFELMAEFLPADSPHKQKFEREKKQRERLSYEFEIAPKTEQLESLKTTNSTLNNSAEVNESKREKSQSSIPTMAKVYTVLVDGKELPTIDTTGKPFKVFKAGVIAKFGADRVGTITERVK